MGEKIKKLTLKCQFCTGELVLTEGIGSRSLLCPNCGAQFNARVLTEKWQIDNISDNKPLWDRTVRGKK